MNTSNLTSMTSEQSLATKLRVSHNPERQLLVIETYNPITELDALENLIFQNQITAEIEKLLALVPEDKKIVALRELIKRLLDK